MSEINNTYLIRDYRPEDKAFIMSTWLRGLYYGNQFYALMEKNTFMDVYKQVLEALLQRSIVKVACLVEDQDVILGYIVLSNDVNTIHWVFIKQAFRKQGIAKSLTPKNARVYSHFSDLGLSLAKKLNYVFNPFSL